MLQAGLLNLIGNTPLLELTGLSPKPGIHIFAKLEGQNPSGSVKDRAVLAMVDAAEKRGDLKSGDTIVEASSGNTAIALAMVCRQKGYKLRVIIPKGVAPSIGDILEVYGADVTWCEPKAGLKGAIDLALSMARMYGYYPLQQFINRANVEIHYQTTGEEIAEALPMIDLFVAGIGTGGTIMGVGRRLRESNSEVRIVGVEPQMGDRLQGLRSLSDGFVPPLLDLAQLDGRFQVDSASAIEAARWVARSEGILAGVSSGATLCAAIRLSKKMDTGNIVVMFSDSGWKYLPAKPWDAAQQASEALDEIHWW